MSGEEGDLRLSCTFSSVSCRGMWDPVCSHLPTLGTSRRGILAVVPFPVFYLMKRWFECAGSGKTPAVQVRPPRWVSRAAALVRGKTSQLETDQTLSVIKEHTNMAWSRSELTLQHFILMNFEVLFFKYPSYQSESTLEKSMLLAGMLNTNFLVLGEEYRLDSWSSAQKMGNQ